MIIGEQEESAQTPITFRLDPRSGVPPYLQLVQQVEHALRLGLLKVGDQLPRMKDVVALLSINPNTVQKAYRELEHKGIASGRPGQGTFVDTAPETVGLAELNGLRKQLIAGWLADAAAAGLDEDGTVALFMSALRDFSERSSLPRRADARENRGIA
jgi:GntR family transcriptional regulator